MKKKTDEEILAECKALDEAYARAAEFDQRKFEEWLAKTTVLFTKRTDYPKLGYVIHRLNEEGIPSRLGCPSFHADHTLYVHKDYEDQAWKILSEKLPRRKTIDDLADDDPRFLAYAKELPDEELWGEFPDESVYRQR